MQNNSGAIDLTKIGLLAPGANPLTPSDEKGINEILRGRVHLNDGSSVTTYVKLLSKKQLINELADVEGILSDSHSIDFLSASESSALIYFIEKRKSKIVEFVCSAIGLPLLPL